MFIEQILTDLSKYQRLSCSLSVASLLATSWLLLVSTDVYSAPSVCVWRHQLPCFSHHTTKYNKYHPTDMHNKKKNATGSVEGNMSFYWNVQYELLVYWSTINSTKMTVGIQSINIIASIWQWTAACMNEWVCPVNHTTNFQIWTI